MTDQELQSAYTAQLAQVAKLKNLLAQAIVELEEHNYDYCYRTLPEQMAEFKREVSRQDLRDKRPTGDYINRRSKIAPV